MRARSLFCTAAIVGLALGASGDMIDFTAQPLAGSGFGSFDGSLDYNAAQAKLILTITNTSPVANGGYLTGIVFRIDSQDEFATAVLASGPAAFVNLGKTSAQPYGEFDAGAALGGNWTGGGSPRDGIAVGETGVFEFNVLALDAASLTALDFIEDTGREGPDLAVRFRGFMNGASDKVPGVPSENVPAPGGLLTMGLTGWLASLRRRQEL